MSRYEPLALERLEPLEAADYAAEVTTSVPEKYSPYAVDWRFLPEDLLVLKDFIRHHVVRWNDGIAISPISSDLWVATIGRRTLHALKAAKVLFIHVPKAGGTSISYLLYRRNLPHFSARFYHRVFGARVSDMPSFSIIRHPVDRLLSSYRFALQGGTDIIAYSRYDRFRLVRAGGLESLDSFVDLLLKLRSARADLPMIYQDQSSFILDEEGRIGVDRLFALNRQSGLPSELNRWLDLGSIPRLNATQAETMSLPRDLQNKIEEIYARDFEIYARVVASGGHANLKGASVR